MASRRLALNLKVGAARNQHIVNVEDYQPAAGAPSPMGGAPLAC